MYYLVNKGFFFTGIAWTVKEYEAKVYTDEEELKKDIKRFGGEKKVKLK